jgi:hypothetical protein
MTFTWKKSDGYLIMPDGKHIVCWSKVRNELNGLRPRNPLFRGTTDVYRATGNIPAMPRVYPVGTHTILGFKEHPDPTEDNGYLYPVFIETDAVNQVPEWELDENGFYLRPTGRMIEDKDNGLHFSSSDWTDGCLRIGSESDVRYLWAALSIGDTFIVTE